MQSLNFSDSLVAVFDVYLKHHLHFDCAVWWRRYTLPQDLKGPAQTEPEGSGALWRVAVYESDLSHLITTEQPGLAGFGTFWNHRILEAAAMSYMYVMVSWASL